MRWGALATMFLLVGCVSPIERGSIIIDAIDLEGVDDDGPLGGRLEIEVHLYEIVDGRERFLSCAGGGSGLSRVDDPNASYRNLSAFFEPRFAGAGSLLLDDIEAEELRVRVIEDDDDPCPREQNTGVGVDLNNDDDPVGTSEVFTKMELSEGVTLSFPSVPLLRMGTFPSIGDINGPR